MAMSQDEGVVAIPEIDVSVAVDVVEFAALRLDCVKRVRLDVTNKVRNPCWKNSFGSFVQLFRLFGP
jgi:hypothetical protein